MNEGDYKNIQTRLISIKRRFLNMYNSVNAGHLGSSLSCAEILTVTKFCWMKEADKMILSKGHAAACLYSVLAEDKQITDEEIATFYKNNTTLPAHPPVNKYPAIPFATGSLGHGLSIAAGFGFSSQLMESDRMTYCITSDGELNEGSTWEAALFISQHKLKNVIWIIDRNRLQGYGKTDEVMELEPLDDKLKSFGFDVFMVDGHNIKALADLKERFDNTERPLAIIANTIKGNGWKSMQNKLDCHYLPIGIEDYDLLHAHLSTDHS
ncbi:MAG: transketolase [Bacteroidia bacterium]|nr:transketolase [Bacteroidia bacterium]